jgi:hypothetical protein
MMTRAAVIFLVVVLHHPNRMVAVWNDLGRKHQLGRWYPFPAKLTKCRRAKGIIYVRALLRAR